MSAPYRRPDAESAGEADVFERCISIRTQPATPSFRIWAAPSPHPCAVGGCGDPTRLVLVFDVPGKLVRRMLRICAPCARHGFGIPPEQLLDTPAVGDA